MATSRTDIPQFVGRFVTLVNLRMESLNCKTGFVIGWDNDRERFKVKLDHDGSLKLIKPANLEIAFPSEQISYSGAAYALLKISNSENIAQNFELALQLIHEMNDCLNYYHMCIKLKWIWKCFVKIGAQNPIVDKKLCQILEENIEICKFPDLLNITKIQLSAFLTVKACMKRNPQRTKLPSKWLNECVEDHYGLLPAILNCMSFCKEIDDKKCLELYHEAKVTIQQKTFSSEYFIPEAFFSVALDLHLNLLECEKLSFTSEIRNEILYITQKITQNIDENDITHLLHFARLSLQREDYQDALEKATKFQTEIAKTMGGDVYLFWKTYEIKVQCYIHLGNKKMARECLKQLKRHAKQKHTELILMLEKVVKMMTDSCKNPTNVPARTVEKCSFYECKKVESYPKEFNFCGNCQLARYCSRECQAKHWKNDHKKKCRFRRFEKKKTNKTQKKKKKKKKIMKKCSCFDCGNMETAANKFLFCPICRKVCYCSRECQEKDWKHGHREECEPRNETK